MLPIRAAGKRIADDLDRAERLANESLRATAMLQVSMMNARIDSELSPYEGQIAVIRVQEAAQQLVEAQGNLAKAHKALRTDFIRVVGLPDTNDRCPVSGISGATTEAAHAS